MRYGFDRFEVDTDRYELRFDGSVRPVEPLVFDLIVFFTRHANRVISREEIIEAVWEGRAVSDATISSAGEIGPAGVRRQRRQSELYPHGSRARLRIPGESDFGRHCG